MNLPILLMALQLHMPDQVELERARLFLRSAFTGREDTLVPPFERQGTATTDDSNVALHGLRKYQFNDSELNVDVRSGRIVWYSLGLPLAELNAALKDNYLFDGKGNWHALPRALTDAEATAIAARIYADAGWPGGIEIRSITDLMGTHDGCIQVRYSPKWMGVPYLEETTIDFDRQTGRLDTFNAPDSLPAPPASPVPGGNLEQARLAALSTAAAWHGGSFQESPLDPLRLVLSYSKPASLPLSSPGTVALPGTSFRKGSVLSLGAGHLADLRAGRAILSYDGTLLDAAGVPWHVWLDARTGDTLSMGDARPPYGSLGGTSVIPKLPLLFVPTALRPWRAATGQKGWNAWTPPATATLKPIPGTATVKGAKVTLTDGKAAFPALYNPKANLLAISGKTYRPGPALAALLKRRVKA